MIFFQVSCPSFSSFILLCFDMYFNQRSLDKSITSLLIDCSCYQADEKKGRKDGERGRKEN